MRCAEVTDESNDGERYFGTSLRIHFTERGFPCEVLARVTVAVEAAVFQVEREELGMLGETLEDALPMIDAAHYRLERYQGASVVITGANEGSVVVLGVIAGLSYWILDKTFGETLKEAWKGCATHEKLQDVFMRRRGERVRRIADRIETDSTLRTANWPVRLHAKFDEDSLIVEVYMVRSDIPSARWHY
jgi:hypothetical protein